MDKSLFIERGEALIQHDGAVYKLPKGVSGKDLLDACADDSLRDRIRELSIEGGAVTDGIDERVCWECKYSGMVEQAASEGVAAQDGGRSKTCSYEAKVDVVTTFTRQKRKKDLVFMARNEPCVSDDAFFMASIEQGYLNSYLLDGVSPGQFPSITEFIPGGNVEKKAVADYAVMKKANK